MDDVGRDEPERAVHRGGIGDHHPLHFQLGAEHAGNDAARSAERVQHEIARIEPALDGDFVDQIADLGGRHPIDAERRLFDTHPQRLRDLLGKDLPRPRGIEPHRAAEKDVRVHVADQHKDVGKGWLGAAEAVADRTRAALPRIADRRAACWCPARATRSSRRRSRSRPLRFSAGCNGSGPPSARGHIRSRRSE